MNVWSPSLGNLWKACALVALMFTSSYVIGQDSLPSFRVDTDIFTDLAKPPVKSSITIFSAGTYYDFAGDSEGEVAIYNSQKQTITLLDPKRKVRTDIDATSLKRKLEDGSKLVSMKLKEVTIEKVEANTVTVGNADMVYEVTTLESPVSGAAKQYAEFANWSAGLNAAFPPKLAPYIRMHLNDKLEQENVLPSKIVRKASNQHPVYSVSSASWTLDADSAKRIERALTMQQTYMPVSTDKYWK